MLRLMSFVLMSCFAGSAVAQNKIYLDTEDAGPDYAVQGEYLSEVDGKNWGAQVVALGSGKFRVIGYVGGLPGAGWERGGATKVGEGTADAIQGEGWIGVIADGKMTVVDPDGNPVLTMKKTMRKSPTLGAKPSAGATILFDGSSADNFVKGQTTMGQLLMADCWSKQTFGDHTLHIEYRTPFKPAARGQARGNSGVYVQSRYEVQVLDSFGLDGKNNECGGIYQIAAPAVNMCFPPLTWQTYDIDFTAARYDDQGQKTSNARITIKHNGVIIHENLELPKATPGRHGEGPEPDGLYLQGHGNPVVYRNIWVVEK